jgi:hypothetical protein
MDISLKLVNDSTLLLCDKDGNQIVAFKPIWTKFEEVKRVKENCNIIRERADSCLPNIYCLNDKFKLIWTINQPSQFDTFPNPIIWNKETIRIENEKGYYLLETRENHATFLCSSWHGYTVTIDYDTGMTRSVEFTK